MDAAAAGALPPPPTHASLGLGLSPRVRRQHQVAAPVPRGRAGLGSSVDDALAPPSLPAAAAAPGRAREMDAVRRPAPHPWRGRAAPRRRSRSSRGERGRSTGRREGDLSARTCARAAGCRGHSAGNSAPALPRPGGPGSRLHSRLAGPRVGTWSTEASQTDMGAPSGGPRRNPPLDAGWTVDAEKAQPGSKERPPPGLAVPTARPRAHAGPVRPLGLSFLAGPRVAPAPPG